MRMYVYPCVMGTASLSCCHWGPKQYFL